MSTWAERQESVREAILAAADAKTDGRLGGAISVKAPQTSTAVVPVTSRSNEGGSPATLGPGLSYTMETVRIVDGRTIKSTRRVNQFVAAGEVMAELNKPGTVLSLHLQVVATPSQAQPKETTA